MLQQKAPKFDALECHVRKIYIENPPSITFMLHRNRSYISKIRTCISSTQKIQQEAFMWQFSEKYSFKRNVTNVTYDENALQYTYMRTSLDLDVHCPVSN